MTKADIIKALDTLIRKRGETKNYEHTHYIDIFNVYDLEIDGSTIDRIETNDSGCVVFYYNINTYDFDCAEKFTKRGLEGFYNDLKDAIEAEEMDEFRDKMDEIRPIVEEELSSLVSDAFDRQELADNILRDVTEDVLDSADEEYNNCDVRLAIVRVLLEKTSID